MKAKGWPRHGTHRVLRLEAGASYESGQGDTFGPLVARGDMFLDQYGNVYYADGCQASHHVDSAGNLLRRVRGGSANG